MDDLTMTVDMHERLITMATDVATLTERTRNNETRVDDRIRAVDDQLKAVNDRMGGIEQAIVGIRNEIGNIKTDLGKYGLVAGIIVSVVIYIVQRSLAK